MDAKDLTGQLTAAINADLVPFAVDGAVLCIRQPTTEEYDDALALQSIVYKRALATPEIADLKELPCSDTEQATLQAMLDAARQMYDETDDEAAQSALVERIDRLQNQIATRTLAEEVAANRAILARDRYLTQRLLCDADGKPVFNLKAASFKADWERLPRSVKDEARPAIWQVLAMVQNVPFSWELLRG